MNWATVRLPFGNCGARWVVRQACPGIVHGRREASKQKEIGDRVWPPKTSGQLPPAKPGTSQISISRAAANRQIRPHRRPQIPCRYTVLAIQSRLLLAVRESRERLSTTRPPGKEVRLN
jgi:hypothetical protein